MSNERQLPRTLRLVQSSRLNQSAVKQIGNAQRGEIAAFPLQPAQSETNDNRQRNADEQLEQVQ